MLKPLHHTTTTTRRTTRLAPLAACLAALAPVLVAGPASASPPVPYLEPTTPFVLPGTSTAGTDGVCAFPVLVSYSGVRQHVRSSTLPDGTIVSQIEGSASITVTNDVSGKTLTYNASGPGTVTVHPDGSFSFIAHGTNLFWTTVGNSAPGVPQLEFATGLISVSVASSGRTLSHSLQGTSTDVCAALA